MVLIKVTKDNEWYTPKSLVDEFGNFDYDPASNETWSKVLNIPNYDTIQTDGLIQDWTKYKRIWINPPFTMKKEFLEKAVETYNITHNDIYILLPINYLITKEFHNLVSGCLIYLPNTRIKFTNGSGKKTSSSPAFGHVILKLQDKWEIKPLNMESINKWKLEVKNEISKQSKVMENS